MAAKLGIVAGAGSLPGHAIAACKAQGRPYFVLGLRGFADRSIVEPEPHAWIRLGAMGKGVELLHEAGVEELVMVGSVKRPSLSALRPDKPLAMAIARVGVEALRVGDDGLLKIIVREIEGQGFRVVGVDEVLEGLLAPEGVWGRYRPDDAARADMARGIAVARGIGALDIGQAVVVQQGVVLGVEAVEGTDALLARCGALAREGVGGVLVKLRKPGQERRADLPTIGVATVENAARAGLRGIAVEAEGTLVVERDRLVRAADDAGLFVAGVRVPDDGA